VLLWAALPVLALGGTVQATGVGIDVLAVAVGALMLLAVERSLGDWLGEWVGPLAAAAIFVVAALALSWYFLSDSLGRSQTQRFFVEAERRGYKTLYYPTVRASSIDEATTTEAPAVAAPAAGGGWAVRTAAAAPAPEPAPAARVESTNAAPVSDPAAAAAPVGTRGAGSASGNRQLRSLLSFLRRGTPGDPIATQIALNVSPRQVQVARQTVITARVLGSGEPVTAGSVEFMVNGLGAGKIPLDAAGSASTTFRPHIPGSYEVRARYTGGSTHSSSNSDPVVLSVVR
jgi:hypothetical protein